MIITLSINFADVSGTQRYSERGNFHRNHNVRLAMLILCMRIERDFAPLTYILQEEKILPGFALSETSEPSLCPINGFNGHYLLSR
jgi:hypothetical protein